MASSFSSQIPSLIYLIQKLNPKEILDIGKGFGKYGFLIHEYAGIDIFHKLDPSKSMKDQSRIKIDAVEADPDLMLPHLEQFYNQIFFGDVLEMYERLPNYDLIMMIDIIEHLPKAKAIQMLEFFLRRNCKMIISTPILFFQQHLYESPFENHVSHWTLKDFRKLGNCDVQYIDAGAIYLLSTESLNIVGFGNGWTKKLRRIARTLRNELRWIGT